jgi:hypothetical protein
VAQQAEARARAEAAGTEQVDYSGVDIPGELPRDVQTSGDTIDYSHVAVPGEENVNVGSETADRRTRIKGNRAALKERIAEREALDPSKIQVEETRAPMEVDELPVQEIDVHGVREERTRSASENTDATARLVAALSEEKPAQGTAKALGLAPDRAVQKDEAFTGREQRVDLNNTEGRAKAMRAQLGRIAAVNTWAKLDPKDVPEAVREEYFKRGGDAGKSDVLPKLAEFYQKLTGRPINETRHIEVPNETASARQRASTDAKAAIDNAQRSEPERAAVSAKPEDTARAEQVAQAQGDAAAGRANEAVQKGSGSAEGVNPIAAAVVRFGGKEYEGATHIEAIKKAIADGVPTEKKPSGVVVPKLGEGDSINLFRTREGKTITRDDAETLVGAKRTEDMPPLRPSAKEAADVMARSESPELPPVFKIPGEANALANQEVPAFLKAGAPKPKSKQSGKPPAAELKKGLLMAKGMPKRATPKGSPPAAPLFKAKAR